VLHPPDGDQETPSANLLRGCWTLYQTRGNRFSNHGGDEIFVGLYRSARRFRRIWCSWSRAIWRVMLVPASRASQQARRIPSGEFSDREMN